MELEYCVPPGFIAGMNTHPSEIAELLIACINFTNLSIARSERRAREVGVRKAIGSLKRHIIVQFLMESVLITLMAFVLALVMLKLTLPAFNTLTTSTIQIP